MTDYDPNAEERLIESMLTWRPAGLIVAGLEHTARAFAMMRGAGIRVAEIGGVRSNPRLSKLRDVIALLKSEDFGIALQFVNYR